MKYPTRILVAVDQLVAVVIFGTMPDETISAMAHRRQWKRMEKFINFLFQDDMHCTAAYINELIQTHNASEYRNNQLPKEQ